jgi:acyl-[acyl-carrier-protein]-phospholipid O-acyltransferase/long-chain-fatty-acid--[acyl-carrier-protein] ligase
MTAPSARQIPDHSTASQQRGDPPQPVLRIAPVGPESTYDALPPLSRDTSFWGMAVTQFLGAFNDNLFKQLILLLATPTAIELAAGTATDRQGIAQIIFATSFLMFSGVAGFLSDRFSKRPVIVLSKVAEIVVMLLGMVGFLYYDQVGVAGLFLVLFLMGTQSAFFGPSKYGILPEMLRTSDLPRANGIFLMLTFLAIIFGTAAAGFLLTHSGGRIWLGSLVCVAIAVVGTITSLAVRRVPVAQPDLKYGGLSSWGISTDILRLLRRDRQLMWAIVVVSMFWMVGGIVQQTVNALGKTQLHLEDRETSLLAASIGVGIAIGCALGGYLSRGRVNRNVVVTGAAGLFATLVLMSLPGGEHQHLLGYGGSIPVLIVMGVFTGMFIVPVQVALQSRPPRTEKGRMIATMNQFSWIGIILGAILYQTCIAVLDATGWPRSSIFAVSAALMLPIVLLYRPTDEGRAKSIETAVY